MSDHDDRPTAALARRIDTMQSEIDALRAELARIDGDQDAHAGRLVALENLPAQVGAIASDVASLKGGLAQVARRQGEQDVLLTKLIGKVGKGTAIAAGVPSLVVAAVEVLRGIGIIH